MPFAILLVVLPLACILGAICVSVGAGTISLVVNPHALINIAVCMNELALAISFVLAPLALVAAAVWPNLLAPAVALLSEPLALVDSIGVKSCGLLGDSTADCVLLILCFELLHQPLRCPRQRYEQRRILPRCLKY